MRLKYFIEFDELVSDPTFIEEDVLTKVTDELRKHLQVYLREGGFRIDGDISVQFDLEEE